MLTYLHVHNYQRHSHAILNVSTHNIGTIMQDNLSGSSGFMWSHFVTLLFTVHVVLTMCLCMLLGWYYLCWNPALSLYNEWCSSRISNTIIQSNPNNDPWQEKQPIHHIITSVKSCKDSSKFNIQQGWLMVAMKTTMDQRAGTGIYHYLVWCLVVPLEWWCWVLFVYLCQWSTTRNLSTHDCWSFTNCSWHISNTACWSLKVINDNICVPVCTHITYACAHAFARISCQTRLAFDHIPPS